MGYALRTINLHKLFEPYNRHACLHDSYINAIEVDYLARTVSLKCEICCGDPDGVDPRELYLPATLRFTNFCYFGLQPTDPEVHAEFYRLDIVSYGSWDEKFASLTGLKPPKSLPQETCAFFFYIGDGQRYLLIAASDVECNWLAH
jgi:hypothetical protein